MFITHLDLSLKGIPFAVVNSQAAKFTGESVFGGVGVIFGSGILEGFDFTSSIILTFTFNLVTRSHPGLH